jgi:hypothetical protein
MTTKSLFRLRHQTIAEDIEILQQFIYLLVAS